MIKDLAYYGDTCLRKKCKKVEDFNSEVKNLAQNLIETLLEHDGAGLAAPQIGECIRMFVIRYKNGMDSEGRPLISSPKVYVNPTLSNPSTEMMVVKDPNTKLAGDLLTYILGDGDFENKEDLQQELTLKRTVRDFYFDWDGKTVKIEEDGEKIRNPIKLPPRI